MQKKRAAFTLTELLAVMVIIAILMGLLLPAIGRAVKQAHVNATRLTIKSLEQAIQMYIQDFGSPPPPPYKYEYVDATNNYLWQYPAAYLAGGATYPNRYFYFVDVNENGSQELFDEAARGFDLNKDGVRNRTFSLEVCFNQTPSPWVAAARLTDAESLYLFLTATYRKYASSAAGWDFGRQPDGSIVLSATVNAGPYIDPEKVPWCDINNNGYREFADAFHNPIRYNNNTGGDWPPPAAGITLFFPGFGTLPGGPHNRLSVDLYSFGPDGVDTLGDNDEMRKTDDINNWSAR